MEDLEEKARSALRIYHDDESAPQREERTAQKLKEEIASISDRSYKGTFLKVTWDKALGEYTSERLESLFQNFGVVKDVEILSDYDGRELAIIKMGSKDAAASATFNVLGDVWNPLLVLTLPPVEIIAIKSKYEALGVHHMFGGQYMRYEALVLENLKKAAEEQQERRRIDA